MATFGRLIFPFLCDLAIHDIVATAADPDAGGPQVSGYDPDFREIVKIEGPSGPNEPGITARKENIIRIPFQEDDVEAWKRVRMMQTGNSPAAAFGAIFHFSDLEALSLVDATTGDSLIKIDDRLVAVYDMDGNLMQKVTTPPGLYVRDVEPNFGLKGGRNLLYVRFESRVMSQT